VRNATLLILMIETEGIFNYLASAPGGFLTNICRPVTFSPLASLHQIVLTPYSTGLKPYVK